MKRNSLYGLIILTIGAIAGQSLIFAKGDTHTIAVVDVQRILMESQAGKIARDLLQRTQDRLRKDLEDKRKELEELQKNYETKQELMNDKALREMERKIFVKQEELQRLQLKAQMDLQSRDAEFTRSILDELKPLLQQLAKERGLELIIEKNEAGVLYHREPLDLTDILLKRYDELKSKK